MSQELIGAYLDKNPNRRYTSTQIIKHFRKVLTKRTVLSNLKKLVKRQEYDIIVVNRTGKFGVTQPVTLYGVKKEVTVK